MRLPHVLRRRRTAKRRKALNSTTRPDMELVQGRNGKWYKQRSTYWQHHKLAYIDGYFCHIDREPDGRWTAVCPSLKGCVTWGYSFKHAFEMAVEAVELHLSVFAQEEVSPLP